MMERDTIVIGAGLTGLSTAYQLKKRGCDVLVLEKESRIGGQICTHTEQGFTFESGPNTGVVSFPEVAELFADLGDECQLEIARALSKRRLIWKGSRFHALPSGPVGAVTTPLFTLSDKFRILGEPWRRRGTDPDESVGSLAQRRLGKSFYEYAVDPFVSGVYAGDPMKLTTRYALPKLYNLEARYGSFIRGSIAKAREPKTERDRLATKQVFSVAGGLQRLVEALGRQLDIVTEARNLQVTPAADGRWQVRFNAVEEILCRRVVTTVGAYALPSLLPFLSAGQWQPVSSLFYAPVLQVSVGVRNARGLVYPAFGGLVPHREQQQVLGILFPSECFARRAPEGGALYSCFLGGARHTDYLQKSDAEIEQIVLDAFHRMLKYPVGVEPELIRIFRHEHAIPQYGADSGARFRAVSAIEQQYPGLTLAGNLRDGIGMGHRICQGAAVARSLLSA